MAKRVSVGDIFEVEVSGGFSYFQMTHKIPKWGAFIAVFEGVSAMKVKDCNEIVAKKVLFRYFYPLQASFNQSLVDFIGKAEVSENLVEFPNTRTRMNIDRTGNVLSWAVTEAGKQSVVKKLSPKQKDYPIHGIINHTMLTNLINKQWIHSDTN